MRPIDHDDEPTLELPETTRMLALSMMSADGDALPSIPVPTREEVETFRVAIARSSLRHERHAWVAWAVALVTMIVAVLATVRFS